MVYYANYLKYLERARTELIYQLNLNHKVLKKKYNTNIIVRSCNIKYKKPGFFEDHLVVCTNLNSYSASTINLAQNVMRNKELIVSADVQLVTVNNKGKITKMPNILTNGLQNIIKDI